MVIEAVLDALQTNTRYAKAIVHLTGLKTGEATGLVLDIAEYWDGQDFQPPVFLSIPNEKGRISWTHPDPAPRIYETTLGKMVETFRQMTIPTRTVVMSVVLDSPHKRPHFTKFTFRKEPFKPLPYDEIWLRHKAWEVEDLEQTVRDLKKLKRKLKGIGYS